MIKTASLILLAVTGLGIAGCSDNTATESAPPPPSANTNTPPPTASTNSGATTANPATPEPPAAPGAK